MIPAREALRRINLTAQEQTEVQRIGGQIVAMLRDSNDFDGTPFKVEIPAGANEDQRRMTYRIVCSLQRRFQSELWNVHLETERDAYGDPALHRLWFAIDALATRPESSGSKQAPPPAPVQGFSLAALHSELNTLYGGAGGKAAMLPAAPVLSVIFGTYNRLPMLQRAVESVRASVGDLSYEIVVCDGGSTDGSRAWLAAQPDVLLVGERRLEGAVKAFNQAFAMTRGAFIANLNDDAVVEGMALAEGVKHLQANPRAGQVAFAFRGDGEDWHINDIYPRSDYPRVTWGTTYANFGITRREVAEKAAAITGGFWATVYATYAADCELSAWCWRLGYTVDKRPDLRVTDIRNEDGLRARNAPQSGIEAKRMYARWPAEAFKPDGPEPRITAPELERYRAILDGKAPASTPTNAPPAKTDDMLVTMADLCGMPEPQEERRLRAAAPRIWALDPVEGQLPKRAEKLRNERVLHVHLGTEADPQRGLVRALQRHAGNSEPPLPAMNLAAGWSNGNYSCIRWLECNHADRQRIISEQAKSLRPTIVFMQLQASGAVDLETIREIRRLADPSCVIATWTGDIACENSPYNTEWQVPMGRLVDLTLHSSFTHVKALRAAGVHNAAWLDIGYDPEQYHPLSRDIDHLCGGCGLDSEIHENNPRACPGPIERYDVAFLGSRYTLGDVFTQSLRRHDAAMRDEVVAKMRESFGNRFGLFGKGWGDSVSHVPLAKAHNVYWRSRIGLNISLSNEFECYSSDRMHRILGCGSLLLTKRFPMMSALGLRDGENCAIWDTAEEAVEYAQALLAKPDTIAEISAAGAELARTSHTWDARMLELQMYVDAVRSAR